MTCYHGGKQTIGSEIANIILSITGTNIHYIEPFCGMLGVFSHITPAISGKVYAGDLNPDVIAMWKKVQEGWLPPRRHYDQQQYERLRYDRSSTRAHLRGFVGHHYSFGGLYFGSYRFLYTKITDVNKVVEKFKNIALTLQGARFSHGSYTQFSHHRRSVIYCDPPYGSTQCKYSEPFDTEAFLDWCEYMTRKGNVVFVSEYAIPRANFIKIADLGKTKGGYRGSSGSKEGLFICT